MPCSPIEVAEIVNDNQHDVNAEFRDIVFGDGMPATKPGCECNCNTGPYRHADRLCSRPAVVHVALHRWADCDKPADWDGPAEQVGGSYEVSDHGRVRSLDRIDSRGWRRRGALLTLSPHVREGRPMVQLHKNGQRTSAKVHLLVLEAFVGPRPTGMQACHNNGVNTDNRLSNLRWDTPSANQLDAVKHGHHAQAAKQTCPRRHLLIEPNLCNFGRKKRYRVCLACNKTRRPNQSAKDFQRRSDVMYDRIMSGTFVQKAGA